jgi:hypothetical protein
MSEVAYYTEIPLEPSKTWPFEVSGGVSVEFYFYPLPVFINYTTI